MIGSLAPQARLHGKYISVLGAIRYRTGDNAPAILRESGARQFAVMDAMDPGAITIPARSYNRSSLQL
jgi:hypothetical protein